MDDFVYISLTKQTTVAGNGMLIQYHLRYYVVNGTTVYIVAQTMSFFLMEMVDRLWLLCSLHQNIHSLPYSQMPSSIVKHTTLLALEHPSNSAQENKCSQDYA